MNVAPLIGQLTQKCKQISKNEPKTNKSMKKKRFQQICLTLLFLVSACWPSASISAQTIRVTIHKENVRMETVMQEIEKQTKYLFASQDDVDTNQLVTVNADNQPLKNVLDQMVKGTRVIYEISGSNIILSNKTADKAVTVEGVVTDSEGLPIIGASIIVKGTTIGVSSDGSGAFAAKRENGGFLWQLFS